MDNDIEYIYVLSNIIKNEQIDDLIEELELLNSNFKYKIVLYQDIFLLLNDINYITENNIKFFNNTNEIVTNLLCLNNNKDVTQNNTNEHLFIDSTYETDIYQQNLVDNWQIDITKIILQTVKTKYNLFNYYKEIFNETIEQDLNIKKYFMYIKMVYPHYNETEQLNIENKLNCVITIYNMVYKEQIQIIFELLSKIKNELTNKSIIIDSEINKLNILLNELFSKNYGVVTFEYFKKNTLEKQLKILNKLEQNIFNFKTKLILGMLFLDIGKNYLYPSILTNNKNNRNNNSLESQLQMKHILEHTKHINLFFNKLPQNKNIFKIKRIIKKQNQINIDENTKKELFFELINYINYFEAMTTEKNYRSISFIETIFNEINKYVSQNNLYIQKNIKLIQYSLIFHYLQKIIKNLNFKQFTKINSLDSIVKSLIFIKDFLLKNNIDNKNCINDISKINEKLSENLKNILIILNEKLISLQTNDSYYIDMDFFKTFDDESTYNNFLKLNDNEQTKFINTQIENLKNILNIIK